MSPLQRVCLSLGVMGLVAAVPGSLFAQAGYVTNGVEYAPAGNLPGDQIHPDVALTPLGGLLVWDDNITDTDGQGISAQLLDSTFSPTLGIIHLNQTAVGDQEKPRVVILNNGGKVVVWQGGKQSFQHIYGAFLASNNVLLNTGDVMINTATNFYQSDPAVAALPNGNAVVTWASYGQDNADGYQGVYAQIMSPSGQKVGGEIPVNQFTPFNQRTPAVAALPNGNFIIAWVSEQERSGLSVAGDGQGTVSGATVSVDIYAREFDATGNPLTGEFLVNTDSNLCANPAIAAASDNTFTIAWSGKAKTVSNNGWDIYSRQFTSPTSGGAVQLVNSQLFGDQYAPRIASIGTDYLVTWTSMEQDGSREGVYAQYLRNGAHVGPEFRVNTTTLNSQIHPAVASDGATRFVAVWSSYVNGGFGMDLMAQRYINTNQLLSPPAPPVVSSLGSFTLSVAWAPLTGFNLDHWNLYVDGATTPFTTTNTFWQNQALNTLTNFTFLPGTTHSFALAYVLTDGRQSPNSTTASGTTWGADVNPQDGLPDNWEQIYWGPYTGNNWPSWNTVLSAGGLHATALQVFLWGADPYDPSTWLVTRITEAPQGAFLSWNTHAGYLYQVQTSTTPNTAASWINVGAPRFAVTSSDSIFLGALPVGQVAAYRIIRLTF